ncbi:glycoside hydrolase family 15 protein [Hyphomicrobium sp.]|uniref:glycoside hydrolase family 15 protein n=1 Tax=Hyphomicrobium sp. TaxID=82 RepID=UPI002C670038|nr:glycoside hydrolase family 15 protein [Hyphomicrobium sp.]HRN88657.1 glycoside hydrolase family 15 protein [Hyphomicrobium sp.]HRQ25623.1 glycoside hydrolase family 15 protein [Hyphomicrobium sp.]
MPSQSHHQVSMISNTQAPQPLDYAIIGNGRIAALLDRSARIVWWCFPRFDGDPVFSRMLAGDEEKGFTDVIVEGAVRTRSAYLRNTAIVETVIEDDAGNGVRIIDFAPRYPRFERMLHPAQVIRRIEPIGLPRVKIRVRPTFNYGEPRAAQVVGSNHIRYSGGEITLRLTTDAPLSYIVHETSFALGRPVTLVFGPDESLEAAADTVSREALERTREYWLGWVRGLAVPLDWQSDVIRAAITLQLCNFDETGAIVAAHTTSVPEAPFTQRNWDYRYCWLRDAYFVIMALNRLGATQTMESYLDYITTLAIDSKGALRPVYGIVHDQPLTESVAENLDGFLGMGPVRVGNQAAEQIQHDSCGSIILGVSQMFIDQRLPRMGDEALYRRLEILGHHALRVFLEPDAGIWEYRGRSRIHTHSATMCWVALDRLARIAALLGLQGDADQWRTQADRVRREILTRGWSEKLGAFAGALDLDELDASVLLLPELGLISPKDPRFTKTLDVIGRELGRNGFMLRYTNDDFGAPETSFLACQFWYIDALTAAGRVDEARVLLDELLSRRNAFGILSEDIHPETGQLWGNLPQTYSMAGIVNSCMNLSRNWADAWPRDTAPEPGATSSV